MLETVAATPEPRLLRRVAALLWVAVISIVVSFAFFASSLCITVLLAGVLSILADPIPTYLERWHVSRLFSSALLVLTGVFVFAHAACCSIDRRETDLRRSSFSHSYFQSARGNSTPRLYVGADQPGDRDFRAFPFLRKRLGGSQKQ